MHTSNAVYVRVQSGSKINAVGSGLGSNFIGSVSGRVYLFFIIIYARRVRVRSDSGRFGSGTDFRTREDLYMIPLHSLLRTDGGQISTI